MSQVGFIREKREIKFLILYVASRLIEPVPFEALQELTMFDEGVDFFEFSECVSSLVNSEHLTLSEDGLYAITEKGVRNGRACEEELRYSVRLTADQMIERYNQKLMRQAQVRSSCVARPNGTYDVSMILNNDRRERMMRLELVVPNKETAVNLTKRFQEHAEHLYSGILDILFNGEDK